MTETDVQNCEHTSYRMNRGWPDRETGKVGDYEFACSDCPHTWTRPAPRLEVEVRVEVRAEARVDIITYFTMLSEAGRKAYTKDLPSEEEYEPWERPMLFLTSDLDVEMITLIPYRPFTDRGEPQPVRESVDTDDVRTMITTREGRTAHNYDWTEEDFNTLRAAVPWLDKVHVKLNEELSEEDLARTPGPLDTPLEGLG